MRPPQERKLCVLVVDDDASFRNLVRAALTPFGFEVMEAPKRSVGLAMVAEHRFDLVLVDGLLPDGDGVQFLEDVRARKVLTPAIFVSAFRRDADTYEKLTHKLGTPFVLQKPLRPEVLIRHVAHVLQIDIGGMRLLGAGTPPEPGRPSPTLEPAREPAADVSLSSIRPARRAAAMEPTRDADPATHPSARSGRRATGPLGARGSPREAEVERKSPTLPPSTRSGAGPTAPPPEGGRGQTKEAAPRAPQSGVVSKVPTWPPARPSAQRAPPVATPVLPPVVAQKPQVVKAPQIAQSLQPAQPAQPAQPVQPVQPARTIRSGQSAQLTQAPSVAPPSTPSSSTPAPSTPVPSTPVPPAPAPVPAYSPPVEWEQPEITMPFALVAAHAGLGERLREAQAAYKQELARELQQLARWVQSLRVSGHDAALLDRVLDECHRIRGTSGSFGWTELATALEQFETASALFRDLPELTGAWARVEAAHDAVVRAATAGGAVVAQSAPMSRRAPLVLAVDPDPSFLEALADSGKRLGIQLVGLTSADEVLARVRDHAPNALLVGAEVRRGREGLAAALGLAKNVRAVPGLEGLPLGFMSSEDGLDARQAAMHAGASIFLPKPIVHEAFAAGVERLLGTEGPATARALLVSKAPEAAKLLKTALLRAGIDTAIIDDPTLLWNALNTYRPHVLFLDDALGPTRAADLVRMVRADPRRVAMPIAVTVSEGAPEYLRELYDAGADDVIEKPVDGATLAHRAHVRLDRLRHATQLSEREPLTGLLTRTVFATRFGEMLSRCRRQEEPVTLCLLDVDGLRALNERRGYAAGDQVLTAVGRILRQRFRSEDLRGRWGGDEFVLAFAGQTTEVMREVVARVHNELGETTFHDGQGAPFRVSMTAGFATVPEDGGTVTDALRAADRRLEEARLAAAP